MVTKFQIKSGKFISFSLQENNYIVMDLENKVDSFVDDFLQKTSNVDEELLDYQNYGWVCDIKNFNTIFEEMAKGQLISKCPYEKSVSSKIPTKIFVEFCPEIFCSFLGAS